MVFQANLADLVCCKLLAMFLQVEDPGKFLGVVDFGFSPNHQRLWSP